MEAEAAPWTGLLLGWAAMAPLALSAVVVWTSPAFAATAASLGILWGGAILVFLGGVRRGLSFRTPGGPRISELAASLSLFFAGVVALAARGETAGAGALLLGYVSVGLLDPVAVRRGEAPPFFARFRPAQAAVASLASAAILIRSF